MGNISANTLFHFTKELEILIKILENGFRPSYCKEFGDSTLNRVRTSYIPMVCFCDLPLSNIEKHSTGYNWIFNDKNQSFIGYGLFGIGLTKEWGKNMGLNPVTYINNKSNYLNFAIEVNDTLSYIVNNDIFWKNIRKVHPTKLSNKKQIKNQRESMAELNVRTHFLNEASHAMFSYMKPYQDLITGQRYYDEREWRFVPPHDFHRGYVAPVLMPSIIKEFSKELEKEKQKLDSGFRLKFRADDIKYILVKTDNDIKQVIDSLSKLPNLYNSIQMERLITRIITAEQIREDF